jgi:hypothetical protein
MRKTETLIRLDHEEKMALCTLAEKHKISISRMVAKLVKDATKLTP